jgi:hypothetical protein
MPLPVNNRPPVKLAVWKNPLFQIFPVSRGLFDIPFFHFHIYYPGYYVSFHVVIFTQCDKVELYRCIYI